MLTGPKLSLSEVPDIARKSASGGIASTVSYGRGARDVNSTSRTWAGGGSITVITKVEASSHAPE